jgi:2'-5' RNA ligase
MPLELRPANRLFVAAVLPPEVRSELAALADEVAARVGGRSLPADNLHVTLDFLGRVPAGAGPALAEALGRAMGAPRLRAGLGALRARPQASRARLVAIELHDPGGGLARLAAAVRAAADAVLGRPADPSPFWPHVTLVRLREPARTGGLDGVGREHLFDISRAALYDSEQSSQGPPRYRELAAVELVPVS